MKGFAVKRLRWSGERELPFCFPLKWPKRLCYKSVENLAREDMFNIGLPELLIIMAIALVVFGPNKLPELAKAIGRAMREFKKATDEVKQSFEAEARDLDDIRHTLSEDHLTGLIEDPSPSPEDSPSAAASEPDETPLPEGTLTPQETGNPDSESKEEPEGEKEGIPTHG